MTSHSISFVSILAGLLVFCGCVKPSSTIPVLDIEGHLNIRASSPKEDILQVESPVHISLPDSLLLRFPAIAGADNKLMALFDDSKIVLVDLSEGRAVQAVSRKGNGPEEYLDIGGVSVAWEDRELLVFDIQKLRTQVYSFEGEYKRTIHSPSKACSGVSRVGSRLFWTVASRGKPLPAYYVTDLDGVLTDSSKTHFPRFRSSFMSLSSTLLSGKTEYDSLLLQVWSDTVYRVTPKEPDSPLLVISLGEKGMPLKYLEQYETYRKNIDGSIIPEGWSFVNPYLFLGYYYGQKAYRDIWDIRNQTLVGRNILSEQNYASDTSFWPSFCSSDGILYSVSDKTSGLAIISARIAE